MFVEIEMSKYRSFNAFVDAENVPHGAFGEFAARVEEHGTINMVTIVGDDLSRARFEDVRNQYCVREIAVRKICNGGQGADTSIATEAMEAALKYESRAIAIFSSDTDFAYLLAKLKRHGVFTVAVASSKVPQAYRTIPNAFYELGSNGEYNEEPPTFREVEALVRDIGMQNWVSLSELGTRLRARYPACRYEDFGAQTLQQMLRRFPEIQVVREEHAPANLVYRWVE
jgi:hypothetical protein